MGKGAMLEAIATENEVGSNGMNTEALKQIVTGDPVFVRKMYNDGYMTTLYSKLLFAMNRLPATGDTTFGLERRMLIIPFNKTYVARPTRKNEGKRDVHLEEKLLTELDGILMFALNGLQRLKNNGYCFTESKSSIEMMSEYRDEINPIYDYIKSVFEIGKKE